MSSHKCGHDDSTQPINSANLIHRSVDYSTTIGRQFGESSCDFFHHHHHRIHECKWLWDHKFKIVYAILSDALKISQSTCFNRDFALNIVLQKKSKYIHAYQIFEQQTKKLLVVEKLANSDKLRDISLLKVQMTSVCVHKK